MLLLLVACVLCVERQLRAVPLFGKPAQETGQLQPMQEGLDVLLAQKQPFAIVSAVGPTRTGKSSILGRAFLRGGNENAFEIGGGVISHTAGVWILSEPIPVRTPAGTLNVLLVDTEGFHGIGGRTSRTYEANLFGLVTLMSSVLIFNSMFPVDASTVNSLNRFGQHAVSVMKELSSNELIVSRRQPHLLWVVQNFNMYNLQNSHMSVDELHSVLANDTSSSPADSQLVASRLFGKAPIRRSLLNTLFSSHKLLPVQRPHDSDEVVANLASVPSSRLRREYLADADRLRESVSKLVLPVHSCPALSRGEAECPMQVLDGAAFVRTLRQWVDLGHITVDDEASGRAANVTFLLERYSGKLVKWLHTRCKEVQRPLLRDVSEHRRLRSAAAASALKKLEQLGKSAITHMVDRKEFWTLPGKVAVLTEELVPIEVRSCVLQIEQAAWRVGVNISGALDANTTLGSLSGGGRPADLSTSGEPASLADAVEKEVELATGKAKAGALREAERKVAALNARVERVQRGAQQKLKAAGVLADDGRSVSKKLLKEKLAHLRKTHKDTQADELAQAAHQLAQAAKKVRRTQAVAKRAVAKAFAKEPCDGQASNADATDA
uniref:Guanylate-binding protein N-terminal domain-containing protein n=1 Tax=Calcidiscus leptoporus TaxID=127549 RepID=A0A7S0JHA9_9EUKA